ncbi:hypothetical protein [Rhodococcus pyridinivorans]|uniref:hypothetical protein n=1 Tax=Rhodococcus pyridinivorans TaxID=103816 RepID=UPI00128EB85F|nr:hypothetical protein [Rhodococcus pyridinivorans]
MALNIVAYRKVSLAGYGEGWDDCYLRVRAANATQRKDWIEFFQKDGVTEEEAESKFREIALEVIVGGVVRHTNEDGSEEDKSFGIGQVDEVVAALSTDGATMHDVMSVSAGADRLKAVL